MTLNKKRLLITTVICLLPILYGIAVYDKLPEQIPTHWNFAGEVNGYTNKIGTVFGIPAVLALMNVICQGAMAADPNRKGHPKQLTAIVAWIIPLITINVMVNVFLAAQGHPINVGKSVTVVVGILLVAIGNYLPKCKQNYTLGIKLPWTLASEENWNRTHRMGGFMWTIGGIVIIILGLLNMEIFMFVGIVIMNIVPVGYSYWLYRKGI